MTTPVIFKIDPGSAFLKRIGMKHGDRMFLIASPHFKNKIISGNVQDIKEGSTIYVLNGELIAQAKVEECKARANFGNNEFICRKDFSELTFAPQHIQLSIIFNNDDHIEKCVPETSIGELTPDAVFQYANSCDTRKFKVVGKIKDGALGDYVKIKDGTLGDYVIDYVIYTEEYSGINFIATPDLKVKPCLKSEENLLTPITKLKVGDHFRFSNDVKDKEFEIKLIGKDVTGTPTVCYTKVTKETERDEAVIHQMMFNNNLVIKL